MIAPFRPLVPFSRIIVTGPQRSGTRACTAMISDSLGLTRHFEDRIRVRELFLLQQLLTEEEQFVLQAPGVCRYAHMFSAPGVAIVLMRRNVDDIVASEKRIKWHGSVHNKLELEQYGLAEGNIAEVKYQYWDEVQKGQIAHPFEIEYESLVEHSMWVPKEERLKFRAGQYKRD